MRGSPGARGVALVAVSVAAVVGCGGSDEPTPPARTTAAPPAHIPLEELRRGGYFVVFRHAATDTGMDTTDDLDDCSRQRNLNTEGRAQSRAIGEAFERLRIPVGRVLASPFCRTRDTARLAFGRVRRTPALLSAEFFASPRQARRRGLPRLLADPPRPATNTVLVTHGPPIEAMVGAEPEEGDAVVLAPVRGTRKARLLATVRASEWARLGSR